MNLHDVVYSNGYKMLCLFFGVVNLIAFFITNSLFSMVVGFANLYIAYHINKIQKQETK